MEEVKVVLMVLKGRLRRKGKKEQKVQYFANTFGKREATKGLQVTLPLYVEDFANTLESLDLSMPRRAGHGTLPLYVEDFALYDHKRSVTSPLYVEVFATTLGSLFRISLRTTYRAPLRGGLCQRSDSYRQVMQEREEVTLGKIYKKVVKADRDEQESPRLGNPRPRGYMSPGNRYTEDNMLSLCEGYLPDLGVI
jgi:hypothetical protein